MQLKDEPTNECSQPAVSQLVQSCTPHARRKIRFGEFSYTMARKIDLVLGLLLWRETWKESTRASASLAVSLHIRRGIARSVSDTASRDHIRMHLQHIAK